MKQLEKIILPIKEEIEIFEKKLKKIVLKEENFLSDDLEKFIFTNPKRLRPIFVFLFSKILNIKSEIVFDIALSLELVHSASLIHDDIIDMENIRRKNPTLYNLYGSKIAVLEGDLLLSMALSVLSQTSLEILSIFSKRIEKTLCGEIEQNSNLNKVIDCESYIKKTYNKTSNLFAAGLESLFSVADFSKELKINLEEFLKNYTLAFQIQNDIDNFIKNQKTDIQNGNYTLPVIYFCMENSIEDLNLNCNLEKYLNMAQDEVLKYKQSALNYLDKIENSKYKEALVDICNYTLRSR